jgi:hypothetical protein
MFEVVLDGTDAIGASAAAAAPGGNAFEECAVCLDRQTSDGGLDVLTAPGRLAAAPS